MKHPRAPKVSRFLGSTLLPFLFSGPLIKTEDEEKGHPY